MNLEPKAPTSTQQQTPRRKDMAATNSLISELESRIRDVLRGEFTYTPTSAINTVAEKAAKDAVRHLVHL
jgi:hypothetical protein